MTENILPKETVMLDKFASDLGLEMLYAGRGIITLTSISVDRPGLRLAGFFSYFDTQRIMLIGLTEHEYMHSFPSEERLEKIRKLFDCGEIPCVIFARDLPVLPEFMECARATGTPIFRSGKMTSSVTVDLCIYLNRLLAPTTTVHGVLMDVFGAGILLTGNSGVGKSETAMELIKRGHRLVADDSVLIKRIENELVGTAPERIRYFMELRGIGIINVKNMYGSGAVMTEKAIELVMELEPWRKDKEYDRIGGEANTETILGLNIPKLTVPVSAGDTTFADCTGDEYVAKAYNLVILSGYNSADTRAGVSVGPNGPITREQAATMLARLLTKYCDETGGAQPAKAESLPFTDAIAGWARNGVSIVYENGIMTGTSATTFDGKANYTIEQAIVTMNRYFEWTSYGVTI